MASKNKPSSASKTKKSRETKTLKVYEEWARLLKENERATRGKKMTDAELVAEMQSLFPERAESSTITRVSMARGCYNKGTNMFSRSGPGSPVSRRYDENGEAMAARAREGSKAKPVKKASKKKASKKKVAAKKASKKKVSKKK